MFLTRRHEPHVVDFLCKTIKAGWRCIDVGAFIGYYTLLLSWFVGDEGDVVAFEPAAPAGDRLLHAVRVNNIHNVRLERKALASVDGQVDLHVERGEDGRIGTGSSLIRNVGESVPVPAESLDTYVRRLAFQRLDLVKVDVEGAELEVLEGAQQTLRRLRPILIIEFNDGESLRLSKRLLHSTGYEVIGLGRTSYGTHVAGLPIDGPGS
jgi:FkbM family methyltransferase